jgi:uncharacterized LabA/DUF88 family protein
MNVERSEKTRVIAYVDGLNLHGSLRANGWKRYYWLNLRVLVNTYLIVNDSLESLKYFSSRVRNVDKQARQNFYIRALEGDGVQPILGSFRQAEGLCYADCKKPFVRYSEKETDVNIGVEMVIDALLDNCDKILLISADSDLCGPLKRIKQLKPEKTIIVVAPPKRPGRDVPRHLLDIAHEEHIIGEVDLAASQFKHSILDAKGKNIRKPDQWV